MEDMRETRLAPRWASAGVRDNERQIDMVGLRAYRMGRVQAELKRLDYAGAVLTDPMNIRYATGSRNMSVWTSHTSPARYCFLPAEGKAILWDFHNCEHLSAGLETISEVRPARGFYYFGSGSRVAEKAKGWADEILAVVKAQGGGKRIAIDRLDPPGTMALLAGGIEIFDGQEPCELARAIKSEDEIACMVQAIAVCEAGMARMREALKPGMTENEIWALLHEANIRLGGEWIETRILASGERTNPWFQECGDRLIRPGDLVSFDTDLIGPFGYCADLSRTYFCGPGRPSAEQRRLYGLALDQIHHNIDKLMRPGMNFREGSELAWRIPNAFVKNRYSCVAHGVGLCDEWPKITHVQDRERAAYDGELQPGMTMCVESYMGEEGGREGVKLEQQVLITDKGYRLLSTFPFEELLGG